ncbi:RNA polymerase sigma factor [Streptomyces sp. WI04-05B]|uniref:RNA polymerase sigma factor n=1 Tax=Streptomyces TaxID=1883 RepID=UPI0029BD67B2|nr:MULTISPECIES: sigma-70 family RNA polymerase sigma factor [unclassified Streptomyces]MDX2545241.1 sigma-70 family RNA polymerase sigma factor [Streptomyces sp. WI04-05B]MDX2587355.1 sigma-70 family RNA polymerase sigma factor [Streptomyces sp. WI04-05A]
MTDSLCRPSQGAGVEADAVLIAASLDEPERFAALFDRYAPAIHRYVARRLGADAADDVTAETFLTAFRIRARYDSERAGVRPWLYGIAAKLISRYRREEVRALKLLARTGHDPVAEAWTDSADDRVAAQAVSRPLAKSLARLSEGDRHVLLLFAWAEFTYQEIAEALDIPVGTVRSRLNRARRKMRASAGARSPFNQTFESHAPEGDLT